MLTIQERHERILYPVVRVKAEGVGGSGTVIYSQPDPQNEGEYLSFILTCEHVIDKAVTTKRDWDGVLKKRIEREFLQQVTVELFDYVYLSHVNSSNSYRANIIAYDKYHDIAILKLDSPKQVPHVAHLIPRGKIGDVKLFTPVYASGCSLLHDPFQNPGEITYLNEEIDNKVYWMNNADSIFGNSGGAIFLAETGEQVGITARVTVTQLGFSLDIQTWMNFCVPPQRLYEFFDEQELRFLYDDKDTYHNAMKRREKKEKEAKLLQIARTEDEEPEEKAAEE